MSLAKLLCNFWFCIGMAVFSLFALSSAILEGSTVWIAVDVFCIIYWVFAAHRTTKRTHLSDLPLTDDQTVRIKAVTRRFSKELEDIVNEARDNESNNGEDKETDKKESSDE